MAVNRIVWLAALICGIVFYFASQTWFSWLVLLLLVGLPLGSLLLSLPAMLGTHLAAELPGRVEQGEDAALHLRLTAPRLLPLPDVRVKVNFRTREKERDVRYLSRMTRADGVLPLSTAECGFLAPEFEKAQVFDALGLFSLRLKTPRVEPMAILPPERKPVHMPDLDQFLNLQLKPKPGGGFAEAHEHRPYHAGDPVKTIHWKLSLKSEQLVVREALEPVKRRLVLALVTPADQLRLRNNLGELRYLSALLLEHDVAHSVVWMDGAELQKAEAVRLEDVPELTARACRAAADSAPLPARLSLQADWVCRVGEEVAPCQNA